MGDGIEWIDFGMMGYVSSKQRQTLLNLVTALVKRDSYGLKRCVLQIAHRRGPIDHGALLDMCEQMTSQFADSDLESYDTGDLLSTITGNLEDEGYDIDPFLTNLGRGLITLEGTVKALSPQVNIMECMTRHIDLGFDPDDLQRMVEGFVMKGAQGIDDLAGLPTKAVETLDMLQKSQLKLGGDFGMEPKTSRMITFLVRSAIFAALATTLFLGACILCSAGAGVGNQPLVTAGYAFGIVASRSWHTCSRPSGTSGRRTKGPSLRDAVSVGTCVTEARPCPTRTGMRPTARSSSRPPASSSHSPTWARAANPRATTWICWPVRTDTA